MSWDLEAWYISKNRQSNIHRVASEKRLYAQGANHSESSLGFDLCTVDETHTFDQQFEAVMKNLDWMDEEDKLYYRERAAEFKALSETLGIPIRSYWV